MTMEEITGNTLKRLPYTLLELINNDSSESVDYIISDYILHHIGQLKNVSIQEIADACSVSKSTISRFCRRAGMDDFLDMKEELSNVYPYRDALFNTVVQDESGSYLKKVAEQIVQLDKALDYQKVRQLAEDIYVHENVLLMGFMQAMNPAVNLQQDLFASGKICRAPGAYTLKIEAIEKARKDDLLIIFSNSGTFIERLYLKPRSRNKLKQLKVWMITGNASAADNPYVDEIIYVPDNHSYISHPTQFNLLESVISLAYAEYCRAREQEVS